jgi:hypothetical protein
MATINVPISFTLGPDASRMMSVRLPGITFIPRRGAQPHTHPVLSLERRYAEEKAYNILHGVTRGGSWIVDIGGNPSRHLAAHRNDVHSCNPVLDPADAVRQTKIRGTHCNHTVQDCLCVVPGAYLSVHSLYYLTQQEILGLVHRSRQGLLVAVVHEFDASIGVLAEGEAEYQRLGNEIEMKVHGNNHVYRHGNIDWISEGYFTDGARAIAWAEEHRIGHSVIYRFVTSRLFPLYRPPRTSFTMLEAIHDNNSVGSVDLNQFVQVTNKWAPTVVGMTTHLTSIYSFRDWFCLTVNNTQRINIPKGAIEHVTSVLVGRPRDQASLQLAIHESRMILRRMRVSPATLAAAVPYVAALGFSATAEKEAQIFATHVSNPKKRKIWEYYNSVITFTNAQPWEIGARTVMVLCAGACLGTAIYHLRHVRFGWLTKAVTKVARTVVSPIITFSILEPRSRTTQWFLHAMKKYIRNLTNRLQGLLLGIGKRVTDVCMRDFPTGTTQVGATIDVPDGVPVCRPRVVSELVGFGTDLICPAVSRACVHNEEVAVKSRALPEIQTPMTTVTVAWQTLALYTRLHMEYFFGKSFPLPEMDFEAWIKRWPEKRRAEIREARRRLMSTNAPMAKLARKRAFVKREHVLKAIPSGFVDYAPRLIQGSDDQYLAAVGPWMYSYSKRMTRQWNGRRDNHILYASGVTANTLGKWYDESIEQLSEYGEVYVVEDDQGRFDGTVTLPALEYHEEVYLHFQPPPRAWEAIIAQRSVDGVTTHGVVYHGTATVKSGDPDTSVKNSVLNAMPHARAIHTATALAVYHGEIATPPVPISDAPMQLARMSVGGDDNIILAPAPIARRLGTNLPIVIANHGFRPSVVLHENPRMGTFFSGRFWPSTNGTIWGPKIGRVLSKTFYMMDAISSASAKLVWLKGVCLGMVKDVMHIPVLRTVLSTLLIILSDVQAEAIYTSERPHVVKVGEACPESFIMMHDLYGLDERQILELEDHIRNISTVPAMINHPYLERIIRVDCELDCETNLNFIELTGPRAKLEPIVDSKKSTTRGSSLFGGVGRFIIK